MLSKNKRKYWCICSINYAKINTEIGQKQTHYTYTHTYLQTTHVLLFKSCRFIFRPEARPQTKTNPKKTITMPPTHARASRRKLSKFKRMKNKQKKNYELLHPWNWNSWFWQSIATIFTARARWQHCRGAIANEHLFTHRMTRKRTKKKLEFPILGIRTDDGAVWMVGGLVERLGLASF